MLRVFEHNVSESREEVEEAWIRYFGLFFLKFQVTLHKKAKLLTFSVLFSNISI